MIKTKEKFSGLLSQVIEIAKDSKIDFTNAENLKSAVDDMKLPIAVVGEFSAGKSTLLNKFIGKDVLAANVKPETAVASELYYSASEYAEGVKPDGSTVKLNSVNDSSQSLSDYVCVRRYIDSENLKKLQPIILVDMPGFASPLDHHNKAIINYLEKGVHYIVLTPVDSGTITASMARQLQNIQEYKKDFTFFVTKTDLRSDEEVEMVSSEIENEITAHLGITKKVHKINHENAGGFADIVNALDPELLFENVFIESIKDLFYQLTCSINARLAALQNDEKKNIKAIEALNDAYNKIKQKRDRLIEEKRNYSYSEESERIASAVGQALNSNLGSLTDIAISAGSEAVKDEINSIVQNTVISKMNDVIAQVNTSFSASLGAELKGLDQLFNSLNSSGFIDKLQADAGNWFNSGKDQVDAYIQKRKDNPAGSLVYKGITTVLALTTTILAPIIEILIIFLPDIINLFFGSIKKQKEKDEVQQQIASQIPSIKKEVRTKVMGVLQEQTKSMIEKISANFEEALQAKTKEIEDARKEQEKNADIEGQIKKLKENLDKLSNLEKSL